MVFLALGAMGALSWPVSTAALGASGIATLVGLRFQLVPRVFVERTTEWLTAILGAQ